MASSRSSIRRGSETLGWSAEELPSRPFVEFVHPDDRERTEREAAALAGGGVTVRFVNRYACKDGAWRWIEWSSMAIVEEQVICASARDVTASKAAAAALETSERRSRLILETARDAFVSFDEDSSITEWNPQAEVSFGWSRDEVLGEDIVALLIHTLVAIASATRWRSWAAASSSAGSARGSIRRCCTAMGTSSESR